MPTEYPSIQYDLERSALLRQAAADRILVLDGAMGLSLIHISEPTRPY